MGRRAERFYTDEYKYEVFMIWYNSGKPGAQKLQMMIPESMGNKPYKNTLAIWIRERFEPMAKDLGEQVRRELEARTVKEKVEMLSRHAGIGVKMQDIAMEYLDEHQDDIASNAAVRLLVEGIRIERESRGIPQAIEQMVDRTDEELLEEVMQLTEGSRVEILDD